MAGFLQAVYWRAMGIAWNPARWGIARRVGAAVTVLALGPALGGCGEPPEPAGVAALRVWAHAGQAAERRALEEMVRRFNAGGERVALSFLPERTYHAQVQAAALAGDLPDVLELDGPYLYNYVWQGALRPLDDQVGPALRADLLPSILDQGRYRGRLYGLGQFDSGLALYARRSRLRAAGARIPAHPREAWSADEFDALLEALARDDPDGAVLDLKLNYPDEWFPYAFSPVIQSAGGDLIDRHDYRSAAGVLNGPPAVAALTRVQRWLRSGRVDPNVDDAAFTSGRVALSWAGHWEYRRYRDAAGADLVLVPLPDFGRGSRTGQGSWLWTVTRACRDPAAAGRFITFLLEPDNVLAMSRANAAVPARQTAIARSEWYRPGGPLRLFAVQLAGGYSIPRPKTPAYPVISSAFRRAFAEIRDGAPVQEALDRAVAAIDQDIRDNRGYPSPQ